MRQRPSPHTMLLAADCCRTLQQTCSRLEAMTSAACRHVGIQYSKAVSSSTQRHQALQSSSPLCLVCVCRAAKWIAEP